MAILNDLTKKVKDAIDRVANAGTDAVNTAKQKVNTIYGTNTATPATPATTTTPVNAVANNLSTGVQKVATAAQNTMQNVRNAINPGGTIVESAQKYTGTPYVWGGTTKENGMDCSGFVYRTLNDAGFNVDRMKAESYRKNVGTTVDTNDVKPGDLLFFAGSGNPNQANHIGIYIGNGQMIHSSGGSANTASNPGKGVTIADLSTYGRPVMEAKRLSLGTLNR